MRTALAAFALVLVPAAAAATPPFGSQWATAVANPARPATRAALTVTLHYPMTCGQPGRGPVVVTLPTAVKRPLARTDVLVAGKAPPSLGFFGPPSRSACRSRPTSSASRSPGDAADPLHRGGGPDESRARRQLHGHRAHRQPHVRDAGRNSLSANDGGPAMPALRVVDQARVTGARS